MLRTLFDKIIYKTYSGEFEKTVLDDTKQIKEKIGGFLNLQRYRT